jgi:perosamine synthetase
MDLIPLFKPHYTKEVVDAISRVFQSGWTGLGPETEKFEKEFAEYIGVKYAVGTNSATAALDLAVRCLNICSMDEVITTPITFVSTAHAVMYSGALPVFCDVKRSDLNLDYRHIKPNGQTRAIIPVHLYGNSCDMDPIMKIARENDLKVIEDCAHACGASYNGKKCGSIGDIGTFSFHSVKNLSCGDGGMLTTNSEEIYERAKKLRWLGISKSTHERCETRYGWDYDVEEVGFKCHANDITSAIGRVQLSNLDMLNHKRKSLVLKYIAALSNHKWIQLPDYNNESSWHIFAIRTEHRDALNTFLKSKDISSGVHYKPLHLHPIYKNQEYTPDLPIAEFEWKRLLTLPLYPSMTADEFCRIISAIEEFSNGLKLRKD